jgi:hypothetical protein
VKSIRTKHQLAIQERRAATARVERRAGGCALRAGVETAALEVARIRHREACREEARGEARRTMPRALERNELRRIAATLGPSYVRREPEPQLPASEAYGLALGAE